MAALLPYHHYVILNRDLTGLPLPPLLDHMDREWPGRSLTEQEST